MRGSVSGGWRIGVLAVAAPIAFGVLTFAADPATTTSRPVTFTKDVAPILQDKCVACHQPDSIAPMSLMTYEDSRPWARSIKERVGARQMPPWHIDKTVGIQKFKNDMSLSDDQIATIVNWVDQGAPQGDPKDMPPLRPLDTDNEWRAAKEGFGQPDITVQSGSYLMPAHHQDVWWRPITDIPITEPRWVKLIEVRPSTLSARKTLHHAVEGLIQENDPDSVNPGIARPGAPAAGAPDPDDPAAGPRGGTLMEWAIGKGYDLYRPDTGKLLLPGSKISWDMHIHAVGEDVPTEAEIGIWFYPKGQEPKHRSYLVGFQAHGRGNLDIPPNTIEQTEGFTVLKKNAILENFQPHMHLRGKAMKLEAILPDGSTQVVSYVGNFNFNWMTNYIYADDAAPAFPAGTVIHVTAWHDNTRANKNNPDPNQWVGSGDRTVDEMAHAWVNVTYLSDEEYAAWQKEHRANNRTNSQQQ
jgi:mono/diheme cytochrome c family protein